jgi:hypothetical protein
MRLLLRLLLPWTTLHLLLPWVTLGLLLPWAALAHTLPDHSGASLSVSPQLGACIDEAIYGRKQEECAGKELAEECLGMKRALENHGYKTDCLREEAGHCVAYGHAGHTQARWVAIASGHLSAFTRCVTQEYGSEEDLGYEQALADPAFRVKIRSLDDGGKVFGLPGGEILERVLQYETFAEIIQESPSALTTSAADLRAFLSAADAPIAVRIGEEEQAELLARRQRARRGKTYATTAGASPIQVLTTKDLPPSTWVVPSAPPARKEKPPSAAIQREPAMVSPHVHVRRQKRSPYSLGLELSLFDRVSAAYERRERTRFSRILR